MLHVNTRTSLKSNGSPDCSGSSTVKYSGTWWSAVSASESVTLVSTHAPTMRMPSAYCAIASGASTSSLLAISQPTRPSASRASHQSSITGGTTGGATGSATAAGDFALPGGATVFELAGGAALPASP